jgi:peptide/nickel transport system substrate-binding protein
MLVGFGYAYADQDSMAILLLSKGAYSYFNNSAIDELVPKMRSAMDRKARYKLAHRIQKIVHEECPMVFLFNLVNVYGVSKQVQGFQVRSDDYLDLHKVSLK